jgi:hypothetical protein
MKANVLPEWLREVAWPKGHHGEQQKRRETHCAVSVKRRSETQLASLLMVSNSKRQMATPHNE